MGVHPLLGKDISRVKPLINARGETVAVKPGLKRRFSITGALYWQAASMSGKRKAVKKYHTI
jgi:hypothetical protein